ncbi:multicopper oxidase domain-containing protein [Rickettsiella grylli]|uniref:Copper efflux ATPase n=1 Tax=Rickettsiella grylli TaxID=59196 RepID=A8PME0_9COXI|nr:multicopper oxidase domain-containing protein [Rickettsiella grylli]EDP46668.1 copper efflux ATPase [Rickettsiella grylli]
MSRYAIPLYYFTFFLALLFAHQAEAKVQSINLVVAYKQVNFTGKSVQAIAVNNQIPGPILHLKEGQPVLINVYNRLNKGTTVHWHGLIVPWQMDGVSGVSQKPIPPGGVFHYRFTPYQSGTYWYHAHDGFQEQQGLYGGIIIDPKTPFRYHSNKDFVVVLSDWSNTPPTGIYNNLKKIDGYYDSRFPLQPSLLKFLHDYRHATPLKRQGLLQSYKMMQMSRMNIYDFSDIAYDAYLLNGRVWQRPWTRHVSVGDKVRLRFINAGASTNYNVKLDHGMMELVQVDGNNIKPYFIKHFKIEPGETYDVLVSIKHPGATVIYAESMDTLGRAMGVLTTTPNTPVNIQNIKPFPEPPPIMMMKHNGMQSSMRMPAMNLAKNSSDMGMNNRQTMSRMKNLTVGTKYQKMIAAVKTNNPNKPIEKTIHMDLSGYMNRYIWFINGVTMNNAKPILLKPGKRYRIIFTNHSMMDHPMHIHGHWFILRNGHGAYDPLLHTIVVPPMSTVVADLDADASGQWFFHCHQLYHMAAGMARVFQYTTLIDVTPANQHPKNVIKPFAYRNRAIVRVQHLPVDQRLIDHPSDPAPRFFSANLLDINQNLMNNDQEITYKGMFGGDNNKLQLYLEKAEIKQGIIENANLDMFYWHAISQFWAVKGGVNYVYRPTMTPYFQPGIGIEGLTPFFIETDIRAYYHNGSSKLDLDLTRDTQIGHNFFVRTEVEALFASKTVTHDLVGSGFNELQLTLRPYYQINPMLAIYLQYQHTGNYGYTKQLFQENNLSTNDNTYSLGVSLLF